MREFKRRFGDTVPILVAGQPFSPQALTARLLSFVIAAATEREGARPDEVVLTHPANWGGYKRELMDQVDHAGRRALGLTCTEPEAAAIQYASRAIWPRTRRWPSTTWAAAPSTSVCCEKQPTGFRILGAPEGVEHLGGIDFDEAVFQHVLRGLGEHVARLDLDDPQVTTALTRLRRDCVEAKEALSSDVDTAIPVTLPGLNTTVRLTRDRAGVPDHPGPARHPRRHPPRAPVRRAPPPTSSPRSSWSAAAPGSRWSATCSSSEFAVPTALDTHPKHDIALGAVQYHPAAPGQAAPLPASPPGPAVAHWPTRDASDRGAPDAGHLGPETVGGHRSRPRSHPDHQPR